MLCAGQTGWHARCVGRGVIADSSDSTTRASDAGRRLVEEFGACSTVLGLRHALKRLAAFEGYRRAALMLSTLPPAPVDAVAYVDRDALAQLEPAAWPPQLLGECFARRPPHGPVVHVRDIVDLGATDAVDDLRCVPVIDRDGLLLASQCLFDPVHDDGVERGVSDESVLLQCAAKLAQHWDEVAERRVWLSDAGEEDPGSALDLDGVPPPTTGAAG